MLLVIINISIIDCFVDIAKVNVWSSNIESVNITLLMFDKTSWNFQFESNE